MWKYIVNPVFVKKLVALISFILYYVFSEEIDEFHSFFTISQMPVSIKDFYQITPTKNGTTLLTYGNEYAINSIIVIPLLKKEEDYFGTKIKVQKL